MQLSLLLTKDKTSFIPYFCNEDSEENEFKWQKYGDEVMQEMLDHIMIAQLLEQNLTLFYGGPVHRDQKEPQDLCLRCTWWPRKAWKHWTCRTGNGTSSK